MKKTIAKIALASMILSIGTNGLFADGVTGTNQYAWGENTGWINFKPTNGNIDITASGITGNAWGENTGWINMQPTNGGVDNTCAGVLSGNAWGESHGWISFSGATIDSNGYFQGNATDANGGDIAFSGTNFALQTDWRPNCDFDTIVYQAPGQTDPTLDGTAKFRVVFASPINPTSFTASDITLSGTTGTVTSGPTQVSPNDGTTFEFSVTGMTEVETVTATLASGKVDAASSSAVNKVSITDTTGIHDIFGDNSAVVTYNFDGDAADLGGNHNGTTYNGTSYTGSRFGEGASFDGVDDYIDLNSTIISGTLNNNFTISFTAKNNSYSGVQEYISEYGSTAPGSQFYIGTNSGVIRAGDSWVNTGYNLSENVGIGESFHLLLRSSGSNTDLFINGVKVAEKGSWIAISGDSSNLILGRQGIFNGASESFDGTMDQLRIFNKVLNEDEIALVYSEMDNQVTYPDVTAPGVPVVTRISNDTGNSNSDYNTSDNTINIIGTAEANSDVDVYMNGIKVGTTTVDSSGDWAFDYTQNSLNDGNYDVTVRGVDANGNASVQSNIIDVEIDTTAPAVTTITSPEQGESTNDTTPLVEGTGEPGAIVSVTSGSSSCSTTVDSEGIYSCELAPALTEGNHTISVTQTDTAGNISLATTTGIEIDTTFPNAATVGTDLYNTDTPSITGEVTLGNGETLSVTVDGKVYTLTDSELTITGATWTLAIPAGDALSDGIYNIDAIVTDSAGNATTDVSTSEVSIDTTAPSTPVVTSPTDGTTTNDTTPLFTGTGEPGSIVTVTDGNGHQCSDTVDASGGWSCNISPALTDGTTATFTTTQTDIAGNTSTGTDVDVTIDTTAPTAPTVDNLLDNSATPTITGMVELNPGETLSVTVDGVIYQQTDPELTVTGSTWELVIPTGNEIDEGTYNVVATVTDAANNTTSDTGTNELTLDLTDPTNPTIDGPTNGAPVTGTAEAGATVVVTTPSGATCTTLSDTSGNYSCTLSPTPVDGENITATSTDPAGNNSSATEIAGIDTTAPADPTIDSPTQGSPVTGTAEPNTTIILTTPSGSSCTAIVDSNGDFSCDLEPDPVDGETITSSITDSAGNTTTSVAPNAIDLTAPGVPVVTGISEDTGASDSDNETSDNTLEISGTAEANTTVEIYVNGISVGTTPVDANGDWTFDATGTILADGNYDVTVRGIDSSGNESAQSNIIDVEIDTTAPVATTINTPNSGESTNDTTPLVEGTGEPGTTVTVTSGGSSCSAVVNATGIYSCELSPALTEGDHTISVSQTDTAGNTSPATTTELNIDTTAPTPATVNLMVENTDTPEITGTVDLQPGETLSVIVDGVVYTPGDGNLTLAGNNWTLSIPNGNALDDGYYEVEAIVTDSAGNTTTDVSTSEVSIDTTAPTTPVVTSPTDGTTTNDTTPLFTGTGEPRSVVTVTDGNGHQCSDTVDASGDWSCNISPALTDGTTATFTITQTDIAGNTSTGIDVDITIDTTAPTAPTVDNLLDNSATPTITGMVELNSGETLSVTVDGVTYEQTDPELSVSGSSWELIIPGANDLDDGTYDVVATVTDAANNTTTDTGVDEITIDATAPVTPTIMQPTNGSPVTGTAEPGTTIVVTTPSGSTCTTITDTSGNYQCVLVPTPLDGEDITVTSTDTAGNTSSETIPSAIDTVVPVDPTLTSPTQGAPVVGTAEPGTTVTISTPSGSTCTTTADGTGNYSCSLSPTPVDGETVSVLTTDSAGNTSLTVIPNAIDISAPTTTTINGPTNGAPITGTAEPGSTINITTPSGATCTTTANSSGEYSCTLSPTPTDGEDIIVTTTDSAGNYTSSIETAAIDTITPVTPTITQPGDGDNTNDSTPSIIGTAEADSTVEIYIDGVKVGEVITDSNGDYTYTLSELADGTHDIQVQSIDPARNVSGISSAIEIIVDTQTPGIVDESLNTIVNETTATITWETTEPTSSQIQYGLTQIVDQDTGEFDIAPRVTSHSLTLNNLLSCTTYFYKTISEDNSGNILTEGVHNLTTKGCIAEAEVEKQETTNIIPNAIGTQSTPLSVGTQEEKLEVEVPVGYNNTDTCEDGGAYFQLKEINKEKVVGSIGIPESTDKAVRTYDLSAYCNTGEKVHDFDEEVTITANYGGQGIIEQNERFTVIHSYNEIDGKWEVLNNCNVNTINKTVTCTTPHFSTFGIFSKEVYTVGGGSGTKGGNLQGDDNENDVSIDNTFAITQASQPQEELIDTKKSKEFIVKNDSKEEGIVQKIEEVEIDEEEEIDLSSAEDREMSDEAIQKMIEGRITKSNTANIIKDITVGGMKKEYSLGNDYQNCSVIDNVLDETYDDNHYADLMDIEDLDNKDFLKRLERAGVIDGDKHFFRGDAHISRVEFLKILMRSHCIEYRNEDTSSLSFTDLDNTTWQAKVVKKAIDLGIAHGDTDHKGQRIFRAKEAISRVEALKLLMKMALIQEGKEPSISYDDINLEWQLKYIAQGEELGILDPQADKYTFNPGSSKSRYSLTKLLERVLKLYR